MESTISTDTIVPTLWQIALDHSATGILVYELVEDTEVEATDFRLLMANQRASQIVGVDLQPRIGRKVSEIFPNSLPSGMWTSAAMVVKTGQKHSREMQYTIEETGKTAWYDLTISSALDGRHIVLSFTDVTEQKQQIVREHHQNNLLKSILNSALNGIIYYRAIRELMPNGELGPIVDFQEVLHNSVAEQQTLQTADELKAKTMLQRYPERGQAGSAGNELFKTMIRVTETGVPERMEHYVASLDMTFDLSMAKLDDGFVISLLDISERVHQNQHIEQQANLFNDLLDAMTSGLAIYKIVRDEYGNVHDLMYENASESVLKDLNLAREQVIGKGIRELFKGVTQSTLWQRYMEVIETGVAQRFEERYQNEGNNYTNYLDISAALIGQNRLLINYTNINETKRAIRTLQHQAVLFNTMSRNVPDVGALVVNSGMRVVFANGELPDELFPLNAPTSIIDRRLDQALRPTYRAELKQYLQDALTGISRTLIQPVGDKIYEVFVGPVANETNDTLMAMAIYRNISQTRRYQRELEQSVAELKRSNENLEQFAYVASHDLQEPLRKIQAFGDVLQSQYGANLGASGADLVQRMQSAAARMSVLIKDLLDYSRLTTTQQPHRPVQLNALVTSVVQDLDIMIQEKRAVIEFDDLPVVVGDSSQLRRLFQNLLSNALKFCKRDQAPHVHIAATVVEGRSIQGVLLADERRSFVRISVEDNGIGFDEKYNDRIFTIFQRLHGRSHYPGTGIGLAICRKITDNHRGYIRATSREGQGATFQVYLPVS